MNKRLLWNILTDWIEDLVNKLKKYLVQELGIKQAESGNVEDITIKTMRAMVRAYATVADALAVASGHPEDVGRMGKFDHKPEATKFVVEDNR